MSLVLGRKEEAFILDHVSGMVHLLSDEALTLPQASISPDQGERAGEVRREVSRKCSLYLLTPDTDHGVTPGRVIDRL